MEGVIEVQADGAPTLGLGDRQEFFELGLQAAERDAAWTVYCSDFESDKAAPLQRGIRIFALVSTAIMPPLPRARSW